MSDLSDIYFKYLINLTSRSQLHTALMKEQGNRNDTGKLVYCGR